ncbi:hypothetical protein VIGAN_UM010100, partial [Vigna angularis var. angularis]
SSPYLLKTSLNLESLSQGLLEIPELSSHSSDFCSKTPILLFPKLQQASPFSRCSIQPLQSTISTFKKEEMVLPIATPQCYAHQQRR